MFFFGGDVSSRCKFKHHSYHSECFNKGGFKSNSNTQILHVWNIYDKCREILQSQRVIWDRNMASIGSKLGLIVKGIPDFRSMIFIGPYGAMVCHALIFCQFLLCTLGPKKDPAKCACMNHVPSVSSTLGSDKCLLNHAYFLRIKAFCGSFDTDPHKDFGRRGGCIVCPYCLKNP